MSAEADSYVTLTLLKVHLQLSAASKTIDLEKPCGFSKVPELVSVSSSFCFLLLRWEGSDPKSQHLLTPGHCSHFWLGAMELQMSVKSTQGPRALPSLLRHRVPPRHTASSPGLASTLRSLGGHIAPHETHCNRSQTLGFKSSAWAALLSPGTFLLENKGNESQKCFSNRGAGQSH